MTFGELFKRVGLSFEPEDEMVGLLIVVVEDGYTGHFSCAPDWKDGLVQSYSVRALCQTVLTALGSGLAQVGDPADQQLQAKATAVAEAFRQLFMEAKHVPLECQPITFVPPAKTKRKDRRSA